MAFGEKLPIPEIVAIGGQSDGKSSLLEALLGKSFCPDVEEAVNRNRMKVCCGSGQTACAVAVEPAN